MTRGREYRNPVYQGYMADPFVLKFNGEYFAYGTAPQEHGAMPILHSADLLTWQRIGEARIELEGDFRSFWAPEVVYNNGTFYLYYSAGGEEGEGHKLRVATARSPRGPFVDSGNILVPDEPFSIDAHPFRDDDGQWYLYYSKDFLEGDRVGTGIVVDRLPEMTRLAGTPQIVARPSADWQLYMRQRTWYERVWDWYTVEGPAVRKHGDTYYCFYSGGAWREPNYGVSWETATDPMGPFASTDAGDSPALLCTRPGEVIGPGHVSITVAPDNVHEYLFYHAWDPSHSGRLMRMEPLQWAADGPQPLAPSLSPQPAPPMPDFRNLFTPDAGPTRSLGGWHLTEGRWTVRDGELHQDDRAARAAARLPVDVGGKAFVAEVNVRIAEAGPGAEWGLRLQDSNGGASDLVFRADRPNLLWRAAGGEQVREERGLEVGAVAADLDPYSHHQILLRVAGGEAVVRLDGVTVASDLAVTGSTHHVELVTSGCTAAFASVAVTFLAG